jgi:small subunit ribosomal protein S1
MAKPKNTDYLDSLISEFNLEDQDSKGSDQKTKTENFAELLQESFKKSTRKLSVGDKIHGKILTLGKEDVFVATGAQHDGVLSKRELMDAEGQCSYKVGDMVEVYVTLVRGTEVRLSKNPTDKNLADDLEDAFDMELAIPGRIVEVCKGGVRVNIKGKIAFCPISQIDTKHIESADEYVGKSFEFKITKFESGGKNIVVSRRKLLQEERELTTGSFLEEHADGDVVEGRVTRLEKYGAFVEVAPGLDGLVHISEIAWSRIGEPSEVLQMNQNVNVKILKREKIGDKTKIALSIKQAMSKEEMSAASSVTAATVTLNDPWSKFTVGQIVAGKVNKKEPFGVFIQLEPGITGLLHKSKTNEHPEFHVDKLRVGDTVNVQIGQISKAERRISLEVPRDPEENDWKNHTQAESSLGSLGGAFGDKLQAAFLKKTAKK